MPHKNVTCRISEVTALPCQVDSWSLMRNRNCWIAFLISSFISCFIPFFFTYLRGSRVQMVEFFTHSKWPSYKVLKFILGMLWVFERISLI